MHAALGESSTFASTICMQLCMYVASTNLKRNIWASSTNQTRQTSKHQTWKYRSSRPAGRGRARWGGAGLG